MSEPADSVRQDSLLEAVEHVADSIVMTDASGTIQYVNTAFTTLTGYSKEEAVGQKPRFLNSGRQSTAFYEELWSTILSGRVWQGDATNRRKDGTLFDVEMRIAPVMGAHGGITGYISINRDVTEQRANQQALLDAQQLAQSTIDALSSRICILDEAGTIIAVNRAWREFGKTNRPEGAENASEADAWENCIGIGANYLEVCRQSNGPEACDAAVFANGIQAVLRGQLKEYSKEYPCHSSSAQHWFIASVCRFRTGDRPRAVIEHINISERKTAEEALRLAKSAAEEDARCKEIQSSLIRAIHEVSLDGIFVVNDEGDVLSHNGQFLTMWDFPSPETASNFYFHNAAASKDPFLSNAVEKVSDPESFLKRFVYLQAHPAEDDHCEIELKDGRTLERYSTYLRGDRGKDLGRVWFFRDITERKQTGHIQSLLAAIVESTPDAINSVAIDGTIMTWNRGAELLFGYSSTEAVGMNLAKLIPQSRLEDAARCNETLLLGGSIPPFETVLLSKDGREVEVMLTLSAIRNQAGDMIGTSALAHDIGRRLKAERRLRESEERFRIMADSCPIGIWVTDAQGGAMFVNQAYRKFVGATSEPVHSEAWKSLIHPEDAPAHFKAFDDALQEHSPFNSRHRSRRSDGQWRWTDTYAAPRFSQEGEFLGLVGTSKDVTDQVQAEQALRNSEETFRQMAENIGEVFWMANTTGSTVLYISPAYEEIWGRTCASLYKAPMGWLEAVHPDDRERAHDAFMRQLRGEIIDSVYRITMPDGQLKWIYDRAFPVRDERGELIKITGVAKDITERKLAEQALRSSEEKFRQLAENIREVFRIIPMALDETLYVSPTYEQVWCRSLESIYRNPASWLESVHPDDREMADQIAAHQLLGETVDVEYRIQTPDGRLKWIRDRTFPVRNQAGDLIRIVGTAEDITERKLAEELRKQSAQRLQLATRASAVGVWDWDSSSGIMTWDEQMLCLYGIALDEFLHTLEDWTSRLHPEDRERAVEEYDAALRGERDFDTEFRILWPDGSIHSIRAFAQVERDADGKPVRMIGTNWDITAQKQAEELLTQTADRLALAASAGGAGIWFRDCVTGGVQWDEQMFRLYGTTKDEFTFSQEAWLTLVHPEDRSRVKAELNAAEQGEREFDSQFRIVWPDGSIHHIRANAMVRWDASGKPTQIVGTNRDITSQKEAAAALHESNQRLESETVRALKSSIAAEAANEAKGEFLANMSHEIRTPMNGVLGMTGLLLDTELSSEQRRYAEVVRTSGESLLTIINDILDFSKIEAKKLVLETNDFNLEIKLDSIVSIHSATAKAKGIELQYIPNPAVPTGLRGDSGRLRQILNNLVSNAIKFTEKGEVVLSVILEDEGESDCLLHFSVRDTGIGIPKDRIDALFSRFTQADVSTTRKYGGTGLGLAISKELAELMGGAIGVSSEEGKGSEFWFTVRLGRSLGLNVQPTRSRQESRTADLLNRRILIAEDNSTNREVVLGILRTFGLRADAVADGAEAINALTSIPYDLVLMDMRMPEMDGIEATRLIRNPRSAVLNHAIPIVALTANARHSDREACLAAGMNGFVSKPIKKSALRDALDRWLRTGDNLTLAEQIVPSTTTEAAAVIFDSAGVLDRLEGDEELAAIVFETFLEDIPSQIQALRDSVKSGDSANSARQAHAIRGACANVGGERLRDLASEMEKAADAGKLDRVDIRMVELEAQFLLLRDAIGNRSEAGE